jgi:hypothetical protein
VVCAISLIAVPLQRELRAEGKFALLLDLPRPQHGANTMVDVAI